MDHQPFTLLYFLLLLPFDKNSSQTTTRTRQTTRTTTKSISRKTAGRTATATPTSSANAKRIESTSSSSTTKSTTTTTTRTSETTTTASATFQTTAALTSFFVLVMGSCIGSLLTKESQSSSATSLWRQATDDQEAELMSDEQTNGKKQKFIYRIIKFKRKQKHKQFMEKFWENQESNYSQLSTRNGNESISDIQLQNLDVQTLINSNALAKESVLNATASAAQFSSRTSSSLDLEWEHEYGSNMRSYLPTLLPPPPSSISNATVAAATTAMQRNPTDLSDSWQFLSQRHYFDEDFMHSHSSSLAPLSESEPISCTAEQNQNQTKSFSTNTRAIAKQMAGSKSMLQQQYPQQAAGNQRTYTRTSSRNSCSHISTPESLEWDIDEEQQRQMHVEDDNLGLETLELLHQIEQLKNKVLNETGDGLFDADVEEDHIEGFTNINADFLEEINIS